MAQIQRSQVVEAANKLLRLDPLIDGSLNRSSDIIQPVVIISDLGEKIVYSATRSATGTATIATCSTSKRTFLNSIQLSSSSSAAADNVLTTLSVTPKGKAAVVIARIDKLTLTAQDRGLVIVFDSPIELEKGSNITYLSTFTVGACTYSAVVVITEIEE